jgi:hypothetical protein
LKPSLKNLNSKDNEVVQMFIKKKTKMPVLLNNNNKQSTKK